MTVPATTRKAGPYIGNGIQTVYPFAFKIFTITDVKVVVADLSGAETTLAGGYTVFKNADQASNPGGSVTMTTPPASGFKLSVLGNLPYDQTLALPGGGNFNPVAVENAFDRTVEQIQQVIDTANRALLLPVNVQAGVSASLPAPAGNKVLGWNADGTALQNLDASVLASIVAYGTANADLFSGTGAQTAFTLTANPGVLNNLDVAIGGVVQRPGIDYTWAGNTSIVFTVAPPAGTNNILARYYRGLAIGTMDAAGVSVIQAGAGAVTRSVQDELRDRVSVKQFGAKGDGITDDTAAFLAARDYLQTASNFRGGVIYVPRGYYKLSQEWAFTPYVPGVVFNIQIEGEGMESTVLDFAGAPGGSNGISATGHGLSFFVTGLSVKNAPQNGVALKGGAVGSAFYVARCGLHNVRIQASGAHGLRSENSFMLDLDHVWSFGNTGAGFNFVGAHTSLNCRTSYALANGSAGWLVNGVVYFHFSACGSDSNGTQGYAISNVQGGVFTGCGAETNAREGWLLFTSTASTTGIPSVSQDVHGIVFSGCYGLQNSTAGPGLYATFLAALTANSRPIDFTIQGGAAYGAGGSDVALVLNGASGAITCSKDTFYDASFSANDVLSGAVSVRNSSVAGRRIVAGLPAATQSTANNTATTLALVGAPSVNDLGATVAGNAIQIPRGVNKVIVSASVSFANNATGVRQLFLYKGGVPFSGMPAVTSNAVSAGSTVLSVKSPPIAVVPGDNFSASVLQTSGGALNLEQAVYTYLSVEAVG